MSVLVVSTRLTNSRREALQRLVATEGEPEFLEPAAVAARLAAGGATAGTAHARNPRSQVRTASASASARSKQTW